MNDTTWLSVKDEANTPIEIKTPPRSINPIYEPITPAVSIFPIGFPN